MSSGKLIFILFAMGLLIVFGVLALDHLNDDAIYEMKELAGIGILSFVFVGSIGVMLLFSLSDAICATMEGLGDQQMAARNPLGARRWYDRCLWLQDHLLNNIWRRTQIAGKHVATFQDLAGATESDMETGIPSKEAMDAGFDPNNPDGGEPVGFKFVVPPAVANSVFYRYALGTIFALVAVVHALDGTMAGAIGILLVGVVLNAFWLNMSKDAAD